MIATTVATTTTRPGAALIRLPTTLRSSLICRHCSHQPRACAQKLGGGVPLLTEMPRASLGNYLTREGCSAYSALPVKSAKPSQTMAALNKMLVGNPTTSSEPNTGTAPTMSSMVAA